MAENINKTYDYEGYKVTEDGRIFDKNGKLRKINKKGRVELRINNRRSHHYACRIVYEAVNNVRLNRKEVVMFYDGNPENIHISNLYVVKKSTKMKKKVSIEDEEKIRETYNRKEKLVYGYRDRKLGPTYKELAEEYDCSVSTIYKILNNTY